MSSNDIVFIDGYKSGVQHQRMRSDTLSTVAQDLIAEGIPNLSTWDRGFLLGCLARWAREVNYGDQADRDQAGDAAPAE